MNNKMKSVLLLLSKLISTLFNFLSMSILAYFLSVESFSQFRQFNIALTFIISLASIGLPQAILYFMSGEKKKSYLPNFYLINVVIVILLIPISILLLSLFNFIFNTEIFTVYAYVFTLLLVFSFVNSSLENFYLISNRLKLLLVNAMLPNVVFIVLLIIFYNKLNIDIALNVFLIREVLRLVLFLFYVFTEGFEVKELSIFKIKEIIYYTIPVGIGSILGVLSTQLDKFVLGKILDENSFGLLVIASTEIPIISLASMSLFNVLLPKIKILYESKKYEDIIKQWLYTGNVLLVIAIPVVINFMFFSKEIVSILYSDKYVSATALFALYQFSLLFRIYNYGIFFMAIGKSKLYSLNVLLSIFLNVVLILVFVNLFGLIGSAIAVISSNIILVILQNLQIKKILHSSSVIYPSKNIILSFMYVIPITLLIKYTSTTLLGINNNLILFCVMGMSTGLSFLLLSKKINGTVLEYIFNIIFKNIKGKTNAKKSSESNI